MVKYNLKIDGHLLQCQHCSSDPQYFFKIKKQLLCNYCDKKYDFKYWVDPIKLELDNFKTVYVQAKKQHDAGIQLKALERFFKH